MAHIDSSSGKEALSQVTMDDNMDFNGTDLPPEKQRTAVDRRDMYRMGKQQEFRRNFSFIPIFGFAAVLMMTWASVLSSASYTLPNGGLPAMIWIYIVTLFGFGCAILTMAEMSSMAPTSGGQVSDILPQFSDPKNVSLISAKYHWYGDFRSQLSMCRQLTRPHQGLRVRPTGFPEAPKLSCRLVLCSGMASRCVVQLLIVGTLTDFHAGIAGYDIRQTIGQNLADS